MADDLGAHNLCYTCFLVNYRLICKHQLEGQFNLSNVFNIRKNFSLFLSFLVRQLSWIFGESSTNQTLSPRGC